MRKTLTSAARAEKTTIALPRGSYGTIVADPPWPFANQVTRAATSNHYGDLSLEALKALRVPAAPQAHLYLWVTGGHLVDGSATAVAEAWGFAPKFLLTWVKTQDVRSRLERGKVVHNLMTIGGATAMGYLVQEANLKLAFGLGNWFRRNAEHVLFAVRGRQPALVKNLPDTFFAPRGAHSVKPTLVHELAEAMSPGPRLELFARQPRKGWKTWGDQL